MNDSEYYKNSFLQKCRHFTGVQNKVCAASVSYDSFPGCMPCLLKHAELARSKGIAVGACEKMSIMSEAEAEEKGAAREQQIRRAIERCATVNLALDPIRIEYKGRHGSGVIVCPVCQGVLRWSHNGPNGHMIVRCDTQDCARWIE